MYIPLKGILEKYNINPTGVIQVGCHWCEEHDEFIKCGIERFVYIEPCKDAFAIMQLKVEDERAIFFNVACGSEEGEMPMYVSHQNQGQSNSLLKPELHLQQHPDIIFDDAEVVKVVTLDSLPIEKGRYDMLVLDVQGFEGEVLKGATETLKHIDIIYTEVNRDTTYLGNMLVGEMDNLLAEQGFVGIEEHWPSPNWSWGDKIYLRAAAV